LCKGPLVATLATQVAPWQQAGTHGWRCKLVKVFYLTQYVCAIEIKVLSLYKQLKRNNMGTTALVIIGIILLIFGGLRLTIQIMFIIFGFMIMGWWFLLVLLILAMLF
jgi:hypothetical protein